MLRVVLDTSVIVSALRNSEGASFMLLRYVTTGQLTPCISTALFFEYEAVLKRPEQQLVHKFTPAEIDEFLAGLAGTFHPVDINLRVRPILSDADDEMVLEVCLNSNASYLVTHNVRDFAPAVTKYGLKVVLPRELLKEIRT
jgi:putative PIN family toxin of toxin-antitoxin system